MAKRSNRRKRNILRSRTVQYSRSKNEVCLVVQDRHGSRTLIYRNTRRGWCRTVVGQTQKMQCTTVHRKAPISHPHTDPQSRAGRGGTGNSGRDYSFRSEVPVYGQTVERVQRFYYSDTEMAAIVASYGKYFEV